MGDSLFVMWERLRWSLRPADVLDVAVVALLLYLVITWLRRRATYSAVALLGIALALYILARWLNMYLTLALFQVGVTVLVLGFLIVFQEEVRAGLERLISRRGRKSAVGATRGEWLIDNLSEALGKMAESRTGALIVVRGREPVDRHVRGGIPLNGRVSVPLLLSLFNRESPAHDGAAIVIADRIERFAAHLPLSTNLHEVGERGTRHTAALGLSERCDALVLVVSEERGTISVAEHGRLQELPSPAGGRQVLETFLAVRHPVRRRVIQVSSLRACASALIAILAAILLWTPFAMRGVENIQQTLDVPVALAGAPEGWTVGPPDFPTVEVTLSGSPNAFRLLEAAELRQTIPLPRLREGRHYVVADPDHLEGLPEGLRVVDIHPQRIAFDTARSEGNQE